MKIPFFCDVTLQRGVNTSTSTFEMSGSNYPMKVLYPRRSQSSRKLHRHEGCSDQAYNIHALGFLFWNLL